LIGVLVLAVACSNIISMLILLVQNKKKEIGILQAMGASKNSIALIFGLCGVLIGIISSLLGILLALLTLHNIDFVVKILSLLQGHDAFNALFFGQSLPNALSNRALYFVLIATPLISLLAGLIPAIKACRLQPSQILRAE
jgi:lipoprotein-releasing system permease protein